MATLHIEHPITDFVIWKTAFDRLADARRHAGVRAEQVRRPVHDPNFVVVDLDFDSADAADAFLHFLQSSVWTSADAAPALAGSPETSILVPAPPA